MTVLAATSGWLCERVAARRRCARSTSRWSFSVEVEELEPFSVRFRAAERHRAERRRGGFLEGALQARLAALDQQLRASRSWAAAAARSRGAVRLRRDAVAPHVPPGDVVGVHERDRRAPRLGAALVRRTIRAKVVAMCGSLRQPWPGRRRRARGRSRRRSRTPRALLRRRGRPVVVAVGEVPLAEPARAVAVLAQHRAPGGEARVERAPAGDHAAGLVGVEAGQQRRARGRAVVRGRVVAGEARPPLRAGARGCGGRPTPTRAGENHCG